MRGSILGIDISSVRLDACLLVGGQPPVLRTEMLGTSREPLVERVRRVTEAVERISMVWDYPRKDEFDPLWCDPDWIVIEDAFGAHRKSDRALHFVTGAIIASAPAESQVALIRAADWREALGAKNTKADGHLAIERTLRAAWPRYGSPYVLACEELDEHQLDAIGIALGWQRILALQATPGEASTTRASGEGR